MMLCLPAVTSPMMHAYMHTQVADDVAEVWANQNGLEFFTVSSVG
jgi:hypothetical protein